MSDSEEEFEFGGAAKPPAASAAKAIVESSDDESIETMRNKRASRGDASGGSSGRTRVKREDPVYDDEANGKDDDDDDDDDDDFVEDEAIPVPKKKKRKVEEKAAVKKRKVPDAVSSSPSAPAKKKKVKKEVQPDRARSSNTDTGSTKKEPRTLKAMDKTERLTYAMQSFLWWDAKEPPQGCQWGTMEHAGVSFPEPYEPHGIALLYDGTPVTLTPNEEEAATFFAAMDPDGMHLGNPKTSKIFIKNFFDDFKATLGKKHVIKDFKKCDFSPIRQHLDQQKVIRKAVTDAERAALKEDRNTALYRYGYALVDGHVERVGNYNMEPPGAFRGRGEHPKMGKLKSRVLPEQVSLNVSECAPVPQCPVPGHAWSDVKHDPRGQWLATWKENINNQSKYMQLAAQSSFKGKSDRSKYNKAALLCKNIVKIRKSYKKDLKSKDNETKQLATAVWVIDRLALRVGGEKDTDEEADTVGCCSLRVEHLHFDPNGEGGDCKEIELEFLGKDSMLYKQTIDFGADMYNQAEDGFGVQIFKNLESFCKRKKPSDQVFRELTPTLLNNHLKQFMDGLSAKVFRTYNASKTLQDELAKHEGSALWESLTATEKVVEYNSANREVAILCNHQRSVSKAQETQLENIGVKLTTLKKQKKTLKAMLKRLSKGEGEGLPTRKSFESMKEASDKALAKAKKMKEKAKTDEQKIMATQADEKAKQQRRDLADAKFQKAHLWEKIPTKEQVAKKIENWTKKIEKMEMDLKHKDDNKEVSLGTSKINYMDPRISVAWCKRNEVPIEKVFSKTLRDKFNWAMAVGFDWEFNEKVAKD